MLPSVPAPFPRTLPLLALRGLVVFPGMEIALQVGRPRSLSAVQEALASDRVLAVVAQKDPHLEEPEAGDLYGMGTVVTIKQVTREGEGVLTMTVEGQARLAITGFTAVDPHFRILGEPVEESHIEGSMEIEALVRGMVDRYENFARLSRRLRGEPAVPAPPAGFPGRLADAIAAHLPIRIEDRQKLLEAVPLKERLERLSRVIHRETELLELERKIQERVKRQVEKSQRDYYLREQMKAIQKELDEEPERSETEEFRVRIQGSGMPGEVREKALRELGRLEKMPPHAAEAVVVRNYLEWLTVLPWSVTTEDRLDLARACEVLEEDHYGLEKVKERILEFLAVRKLVDTLKGPILCLVGPPGVGKTSLARSVARALGRNFVRVSLGGVRDEAEIRGHRRTYVGAMPGRIVQGMRLAGSRNPVFLLDEIDKLSADFRGDPAAALLEVLDPEHNHSFSDHYIEVPFDLSGVLFITTANSAYTIPRPLLDRMETIFLGGYTEEEKVQIARRHLVPRLMHSHGLEDRKVTVTDEALRVAVREYTREAGVRQFERELAAVCRKLARRALEAGEDGPSQPIKVTAASLRRLLGPAPFRQGLAEPESQVGVGTGIGWTEYGGDIMPIEVSVMKGKGSLYLTGKLGEVMRESAQAALSYIRSRAAGFGIDADFHERYDIHIHIPEGAVPKDGPSAGIAMATALVSALSGTPVRRDVAITGEITLRGRVLPVGGIKEKVLAAHRAGIATVILPEENRKDVEEVPANVRRRLRFVFVRRMEEVLQVALVRAGAQPQTEGTGRHQAFAEFPPLAVEH